MPYSDLMDLQQVITELRAELESVDQVILALERLAGLRKGRESPLASVEEEVKVRRGRIKNGRAERDSASAAASE